MRDSWWVKPEQLDDHQRRAIALPPEGKYLVTGPPGSGKTNLLMLRANYLAKSKLPNHLFLVFNRTLEEFIANCPTPYRIDRDKLKTLLRWEMSMINDLGGTPATKGEFSEKRKRNCEILTELLKENKLSTIYDAILLDEAQDYWEMEVELLSSLSDNIFAVADSRQQIYEHDDPVPLLASICDHHLELPHHYRNGQNICKVLDGIGAHWSDYSALLPSSQYNEKDIPSRATLHPTADIDEQLKAVLKAIPTQLKAYPNEMIGIICPRHEDFDAATERIQASEFKDVTVFQGGNDGYVPFNDDTRICVVSVHGAKGLEFRAVHILNAQAITSFRKLQRKMTYTGFSRAKTSLDVYRSPDKRIANYVEGAFAAAEPRSEPPAIEDLFNE